MFPPSVSRLHRPGMASPSGSQGLRGQSTRTGTGEGGVTWSHAPPEAQGDEGPAPSLLPASPFLPLSPTGQTQLGGEGRGAWWCRGLRVPQQGAGGGALSGAGQGGGVDRSLYTQRVGRKGPPPRPDVCRVPACCMGVAAGRRRCAGPTRLLGRVLGDERHFPGRARQKGEQARSHGDFACLASCWLRSIAGL